MKQFILLMVLMISISNCNNRSAKLIIQSSDFLEFDEYGVREKPILNREYIIFLAWYLDTYGLSYPEKILEILPENSIEPNLILSTDYSHLTTKSSGILSQYILNSKYLNYPLIGLRVDQILELQKWLSDRYNENRLIDLGILNFNPLQMDEDCFVTESYLVEQYQGDLRKDKYINWEDKEFLPVFRLPFKEEIISIKNKALFKMVPYEFNKNDFLWKWDQHYLSTQNKELTINTSDPLTFNYNSDYIAKPADTFTIQDNKKDVFKDSFYPKLEGIRDIEDFSKYPFKMKEKYGHMNFTIIGNDKSGKPKAINNKLSARIAIQNNTNKISLLVYSKIIH